MTRRLPRLDLSPPDPRRQVAEFCVEFPQYNYDDILRACRSVEKALQKVRRLQRQLKEED
jgi:hypothetical protein